MAGLYLAMSPLGPGRRRAIADRIRDFDDEVERTVALGELTCLWTGVNDVEQWGPASDPRSGNAVITSGRVSMDEAEWKRAEGLSRFEGGLASRILLERFEADGIEGVLRHNGPAAVLVWDNRTGRLHLLTDHMGYHPIFLYRPDAGGQCVIATSPDAIAADAAVDTEIDDVSIAEFLSGWRATPPNTYYRDIRHAGAACHHVWEPATGRHTVREYWRPFRDGFYESLDEAAGALEDALARSIRIRTLPRLGPVVCFSSGGLDSRAVLFGASRDVELAALNLYDVPGRDAQITRRLCDATGRKYVGYGRDEEYYPRLMDENARAGNGMWSLEDQHYLGTREYVASLGARTVMTACTTDWVFKGYGLEKTYRSVLGRNLPIQKLTPRRLDEFLPNHRIPVAEEYLRRIRERYDAWTAGLPRDLTRDIDWLEVEDRRVRPACYAVSVSGGIMYRIFPYDTFLGDRAIADCYGRMPARWKLNSRVWGLAVRRMGGAAGKTPDSGSGFAPGDSIPAQVLKFGLGWVRRRIPLTGGRSNHVDSIVAEGSWPNYGWCIRNSRIIARSWNDATQAHRDLLNGIFGEDLWAKDLDYWSRRPNDCFRLLTMVSWLRATGR